MKPEKIFRFWIAVSAFWIASSLILGGKVWVFPYPFQEAWKKQQFILKQTWKK